MLCQVCQLFFRSIQSVSEINTTDQAAATQTSTNASVLGVLGVIIVILTLLLVVALLGMLHMYRKMQQTTKIKMNRKRTLSRYNNRFNNNYCVCFTVSLVALQMHQNMLLTTQPMEKMSLLYTIIIIIILWKMELSCIAELI